MRALLTAVTCPKGRVMLNLASHLALLETGHRLGCDLVLLPEMSLTGYRAGAAVTLDDVAVRTLLQATGGSAALCFGLVERAGAGGLPYITQVVAAGGEVVVVHRKAHLGE